MNSQFTTERPWESFIEDPFLLGTIRIKHPQTSETKHKTSKNNMKLNNGSIAFPKKELNGYSNFNTTWYDTLIHYSIFQVTGPTNRSVFL